jgi:hypothetical protein
MPIKRYKAEQIVIPPEIKKPVCCDGDIDVRAPMFSTES